MGSHSGSLVTSSFFFAVVFDCPAVNANTAVQSISWDGERTSENYFAHLPDHPTESREKGRESKEGDNNWGEEEMRRRVRQRK